MSEIIHFRIDGKPEPQGRPRASRIGGNIRMYDPPKSKAYKQVVALTGRSYMARNQYKPLTSALKVTLGFYFRPPKSYSKKRLKAIESRQELYTKKPDVDNLAKGLTDALNDICYEDDAQIIEMVITKQYADEEYAEITIEEVEGASE